MASSISYSSNSTYSAPQARGTFVVTLYAILLWFVLALLGSLQGTFVQPPGIVSLPTYLAAFGPAMLFIAVYLLFRPFRQFVGSLIGNPWGIAAVQIYRVIGVVWVVLALRHALPTQFALPAGWGDFFIGVTAPLAALGYSSGHRLGKVAFVVWNVLGLLDLVMAVSLAVASSSIPPGTMTLRVFPLSLIPTFAVPLSVILHCAGLGQSWLLSRK